jgi:hypothetical protein
MKEKSELETVALRLYLPAGKALHSRVYIPWGFTPYTLNPKP